MIYIHENGKRRSRVKRIRKEYIEGTQLLMRIHTYINKCCVNCLISDSFFFSFLFFLLLFKNFKESSQIIIRSDPLHISPRSGVILYKGISGLHWFHALLDYYSLL